jgi:hypothetical protein
MANKHLSVIGLVALGLFILMILLRRIPPQLPISTDADKRILFDSIKLNNNTLYWFKYQGGVTSSPISYLCIANNPCSIEDSISAVKGERILSIAEVRNDTVFLLSRYGFDVNSAYSSGFKFVNRGYELGKQYKRLSLQNEVPLSTICK